MNEDTNKNKGTDDYMEASDSNEVNNDVVLDEEEGDYLKVVKKLREKLKSCELEKQQYLEGWQRAKADYINAKKLEEKNLSELEPLIKERLLSELLPVADNFDMAFANKEVWEKVDKNWRMGVEGIYSSLLNTFSSFGLLPIGKVGDKFNPEEYQAVTTIPVEEKENDDIVVDILQKGYKFRNKVIRPCKVRVSVYKN
ncbi:MAG: nucleotide exchange factor GrpE [bacterium]